MEEYGNEWGKGQSGEIVLFFVFKIIFRHPGNRQGMMKAAPGAHIKRWRL